ncbi:MAG: F0F1 ATP synthase subunit A [Tannerella sp.]|jgi:F-type H+-transporting ATPase subunit a|nr:F0F1 ATP synthase subunit A [Tannerella sp.]
MKVKINRYIKVLFILFFTFSTVLNSHAAEETPESEPFDPAAVIFEHIQDAYWWHITTIKDKHISIYLPVILYSKSSGWHVFSSSRLDHGHEYAGFHINSDGKIVEKTTSGEEVKPIDLSFTKNAADIMISSAIMLFIFLSAARWYRRHPKNAVPNKFVSAVEMLVMSVEDDIIRKSIGEKHYKRYSPYLLYAFFFILINNLLGLIPIFPGGANLTGNITITFFLAFCTLIAINLFGNREYWKEIFWPDVPTWLKVPIPLMPLIELFGVLSKPFALMIRLFANIMAGHSAILAITCLIFITAKMGMAMNAGMTVFAIILSIFMDGLELLVAYIQAFVFTMLSAVFIGMSLPEHHQKATKRL